MATYRSQAACGRPVIWVQISYRHDLGIKLRDCSWGDVVEMYSRLKLTFVSDKLPAISGVAKRMMEKYQEMVMDDDDDQEDEEYHAGLWKSTFFKDLCWEYVPLPQHSTEGSEHDYHPEYTAPSWSWASQAVREVRWVDFPDKPDTEAIARVTKLELVHMGEGTLGAVRDGYVVLYGRSLPVTMLEDHSSIDEKGSDHSNKDASSQITRLAMHGRYDEKLEFITCNSGAFDTIALQRKLITYGSVQC